MPKKADQLDQQQHLVVKQPGTLKEHNHQEHTLAPLLLPPLHMSAVMLLLLHDIPRLSIKGSHASHCRTYNPCLDAASAVTATPAPVKWQPSIL
jgi:hypothetical protein